jgi:hypothetical protein
MKITVRRLILLVGVVCLAVLGAVLVPGSAESDEIGNAVLAEEVAIELGQTEGDAGGKLPEVSGAPVIAALEATGALDERAEAAGAAGGRGISRPGTEGCQNRFVDEATGRFNIRVNQDCSLRRQAEEVIAVNPNNPQHLIAGQNDSRIGFNHCGYDWSFNGGRTWGDQIPPFWQFQLLDGHTSDACSDPTATFDGNGNAYVGGLLFDVAAAPSAIVVAKSNAQIGGAFYHTPFPLSFQAYRTVPLGVVANDAGPTIFNDKEFIVADQNFASPKANNVYATWTRFEELEVEPGGRSPIYFSQSTDGGATWSPGIEISGSAPVCTDFSGVPEDPNRCDQDQGSDPYVGPDGTLYVAFGNGNTPEIGFNQILIVRCPATRNCADPASWTQPVKVNDLVGTHPIGVPGDPTGCPPGRQCLPPNGYRAPEFTGISVSVDNRSRVYVAWWDTRNLAPPCEGPDDTIIPTTAASPPCDSDVFYAYSTDRGATWSDAVNVQPSDTPGAGPAQWQSWSDVTADGRRLYIAYYDRSYGNCETEGCNDITLATVTNAATASPSIERTRITTESMPNLVLANNPLQAGFLGDYMWVDADRNGRAHIVWADTRGLRSSVEEDIYYARQPQ